MKLFGYQPAQVRKAIAGGLAGAVPLFAVDIADLHISRGEVGGLVGAFALGAAAVFGIRNAPTRSTRVVVGERGPELPQPGPGSVVGPTD